VLDNIRLSNPIVAELDDAFNRGERSADEAAREWLARHPQMLRGWLAPVS
jgi:glycine betaine/proline transport system substrate-binding protein